MYIEKGVVLQVPVLKLTIESWYLENHPFLSWEAPTLINLYITSCSHQYNLHWGLWFYYKLYKQVAWVSGPDVVGGSGSCSCMLLLHICADAGSGIRLLYLRTCPLDFHTKAMFPLGLHTYFVWSITDVAFNRVGSLSCHRSA